MTAAPRRMPRGMVVILLDSLNRHMLGACGGTEFDTAMADLLRTAPLDVCAPEDQLTRSGRR
jgi:hypothetical protein